MLRRNTFVRLYFNDSLVDLHQHSLQQPAWFLTISPAILQQLCHTARLLHESWREALWYLHVTRMWQPFSQSNGSISKLVAVQVKLNAVMRGHIGKMVHYICLILQMSLWKIVILEYIKILVGTTMSFPNLSCDLSHHPYATLRPCCKALRDADWGSSSLLVHNLWP